MSVRRLRFQTLLICNRAVKVREKSVIYQYAGENPQKRITTFLTKQAAREAAHLLLMDLRQSTNDQQYNSIMDSFRAAINAGIAERRDEGLSAPPEVVDVACPGCGAMLQLAPIFVDKAQDLCPNCNAVRAPIQPLSAAQLQQMYPVKQEQQEDTTK